MKKILIVLLTISMLLAAFSGCAVSTETEASPAPEQVEASALVETEKTTGTETQQVEEAMETEPETIQSVLPIFDEKRSFTALVSMQSLMIQLLGEDVYNTTSVNKLVEEMTNVHIDWNAQEETTFSEKLNLIIAGSDYPDLWICGISNRYPQGEGKLVEDEVCIDLATMIEENAPHINELLKTDDSYAYNVVLDNGQIPAIWSKAAKSSSGGMVIRKDWLDELGMEVPVTIDDLDKVMKAFQSEYGCEMPLPAYNSLDTGLCYAYNFSNSGISFGDLSWQRTDDNSSAICSYVTQGFKDYLLQLNEWYEGGLLNDDMLSLTMLDVESLLLSGECGIMFSSPMALGDDFAAKANDENFEIVCIPDIRLDAANLDQQSYVGGISGGRGMADVAISPACEEPEALVRYIDWFFDTSEEGGSMLVNFGIEGEAYDYDENGDIYRTDLIINNPDGLAVREAQILYGIGWAPTVTDQRAAYINLNEKQIAADMEWMSRRNSTGRSGSLTDEEQEEVSKFSGDIATLFFENMIKVVVGDMSMEEYESVIEEANRMGLAKMVEYRNNAYERANSK